MDGRVLLSTSEKDFNDEVENFLITHLFNDPSPDHQTIGAITLSEMNRTPGGGALLLQCRSKKHSELNHGYQQHHEYNLNFKIRK